MASDRSRFSYDEAQQYRSVVLQQGKVLLDSDFDEAQQILAEETRREALDFVGPTGTPDDGYKVTVPSPSANFNFNVGAGTMYAGGNRVSAPVAFTASKQFDWLTPDAAPNGAAKEYVWLELIEHEVSALEDGALLEPALGGPDTAQRGRILQRVRRTATSANSCADALKAQITAWTKEGRALEEATARLLSSARLQVSHVLSLVNPSPCDPIAHGGFLGSENQLIRVRVSGPSKFVWAFDDASALYRVSEVRAGNQVVLANVPVDDVHQPRQTQVAELLRATTRLANGNPVTEPYGPIVKLAGDYRADDRSIKLASLPAGYDSASDSNPLFVRIWESEEAFTANNAVKLGETGLQVTLTLAAGGTAFADGDFWAFAVRPKLPADVFPARYLKAPQPPEGPRRWACGLAVLEWTSATAGKVVSDCRLPFDNLVELTARKEQNSCCSVMITPADVKDGSLQPIVDRAKQGNDFKICFLPGIYELTDPIVVGKEHGRVSFEACRGGVALTGSGAKVKDGLVQLIGATGITFDGIQFRIPFAETARSGADRVKLATCIGIRTIDVSSVTVENCEFVFPSPVVLENEQFVGALGAGVLSNGRNTIFALRDCTFAAPITRGSDVGVTYVGLAAVPGFFATPIRTGPIVSQPGINLGDVLLNRDATLVVDQPTLGTIRATPVTGIGPAAPIGTGPAGPSGPLDGGVIIGVPQPGPVPLPQPPIGLPPVAKAAVTSNGSMLPVLVDAVKITGNRFANLHTAALICGDAGALRIDGNEATRCTNGFVIIANRWIPAAVFLTRARIEKNFSTLVASLATFDTQKRWNAVQAAAELFVSFAHPEVATVVSALSSIDLPSSQSANTALVPLKDGLDENALLQPLVEAATSSFPVSSSALDLFDVSGKTGVAQQLRSRLAELWSQTTSASLFFDTVAAGLGFGSLVQQSDVASLDFDCSGNTVRAVAGIALLLLDDPRSTATMAVVADNRFTNNSLAMPTAVTAFVSRSDVNGNLVQNATSFDWKNTSEALRLFWSMLVIPGSRPAEELPAGDQVPHINIPPLVAVMSNVFKGWAVLPPRPLPAPFADSWLFLNTVSW